MGRDHDLDHGCDRGCGRACAGGRPRRSYGRAPSSRWSGGCAPAGPGGNPNNMQGAGAGAGRVVLRLPNLGGSAGAGQTCRGRTTLDDG